MTSLDGDNMEVATRSGNNGSVRQVSWWLVASVALFIVAIAIELTPLWRVVHNQWTTVRYYQHGYIVAALALWVGWRGLRSGPTYRIACDWRYAIALFGVLVLMSLMEILYLNVPRVFLLPPLIVASVGMVFGYQAARRIFWAAMLLYCALPVWSVINSALQSLTTGVVSYALDATGVVAFIEGNFVRLPAGSFEIAEECSGLKYVIVAVTLGFFYGLAFLRTWPSRLYLIAAAVALAIICNWVRVYSVILAGHLSDMQHYLVAEDHIVFGWVLYGIFMLPLIWIAQRLESRYGLQRGDPSRPVVAYPRAILAASLIAAVAMALPRFATLAVAGIEPVQPQPIADLHQLESGTVSGWRPVFSNALEESAIFEFQGVSVDFYRAFFPLQDIDHRLIRFESSFVPDDWRSISEQSRQIGLGTRDLHVVEAEGFLGGSRRVVWGWYRVAGRLAAHPLEAKILELAGLFRGRRDAEAFAVSVECADDCLDARGILESFIRNRSSQIGMESRWEQG